MNIQQSYHPVLVFDHSGPLAALAEECHLAIHPMSDEYVQDETQAAEALLKDASARILLVHIDTPAWKRLCAGATEEHVLLRFRTDGFAASEFESSRGLAISINPKIVDSSPAD